MLLFINSVSSKILSRRASQHRRAPLTLIGSAPSNALNDPMAFPNTIKYYITGDKASSRSSSESESAAEESASIEASPYRAVDNTSRKLCEAHSQGTKRKKTRELCNHDCSR